MSTSPSLNASRMHTVTPTSLRASCEEFIPRSRAASPNMGPAHISWDSTQANPALVSQESRSSSSSLSSADSLQSPPLRSIQSGGEAIQYQRHQVNESFYRHGSQNKLRPHDIAMKPIKAPHLRYCQNVQQSFVGVRHASQAYLGEERQQRRHLWLGPQFDEPFERNCTSLTPPRDILEGGCKQACEPMKGHPVAKLNPYNLPATSLFYYGNIYHDWKLSETS